MSGWERRTQPKATYVDEREARRQIADVSREIYERRLSGATDGNLSVRIGPARVATTPSGVHKGRLRPEDIVIVDLEGHVVSAAGGLRPSSEIGLHVMAYARRPDIRAVVHAHPPLAIAYQLAGGHLSEVLVSEVVFACGQIATAPYTTPTTNDVPAVLGDYLGCYDVILMERHGSVTLGPTLDLALARLDALEHTAQIYCTVRMMGGAPPIPRGEVDRLFDIAHPQRPPYRTPGSRCPPAEPEALPQESASGLGMTLDEGALVQAVLAELRRGRR